MSERLNVGRPTHQSPKIGRLGGAPAAISELNTDPRNRFGGRIRLTRLEMHQSALKEMLIG